MGCPGCQKEASPPGVDLPGRASVWSIPFELLIRLYQITLSRFLGGQCRYWPTCSHYGLKAYRSHGVVRGTWLTARRVLRCHPFAKGGYDPVPPVSGD
ncbi:MAG TPA: membrane protein insertion efficiency factor YidD [Phycisphaerales bacterium]|nr:membrane protein insertion efficiency factor YidD [Phycisphaerales bacterium]